MADSTGKTQDAGKSYRPKIDFGPLWKRMRHVAVDEGVSASEVARQAVRFYLEALPAVPGIRERAKREGLSVRDLLIRAAEGERQ